MLSFWVFLGVGVPSRVGIRGNEKADCCQVCFWVATCQVREPYTDFIRVIREYVFHLTRWMEWCSHKQASFSQASPREIGSGRMKLCLVVPTSVIYI